MSMNGWIVACEGHQWKSPCTSPSGFSDVVTITYNGTAVNTVRKLTTHHRKIRNEVASRTTGPPSGQQQPEAGHHQQEQQQEHRHRGPEPEVPVHEGVGVDVDGDDVRLFRRRRPEEHERRVEVVEGPE